MIKIKFIVSLSSGERLFHSSSADGNTEEATRVTKMTQNGDEFPRLKVKGGENPFDVFIFTA